MWRTHGLISSDLSGGPIRKSFAAGAAVLTVFGMSPVVGAHGAPTILAPTIDGTQFDLAAEHGHVVIINFWATWCAPCRAEMPALDQFLRSHKSEGLELAAISMDDRSRLSAVRAIAAQYTFRVAIGARAKIASDFRPSALPVTLVFDRDGALRYDSRRHAGLMDIPTLDRIVGPLLVERTDH